MARREHAIVQLARRSRGWKAGNAEKIIQAASIREISLGGLNAFQPNTREFVR
ncbi:hypothetical protein RISK_002093 [Rhodopirellula islandica]|uniref:Uncharacterized protein n=1 Tax=Rhodopirellula islandica TaxID=595434 RepID=A0A0J1BFZ8_RHOIS|nr:hypothetical protein RISK_002093 [Rhodopirellula islandica]